MKDKDFNEKCIVDINPSNDKNINKELFYMFWRMKESGMEDAFIHMEKDLTRWWNNLWERYELKCEQQVIKEKLVKILKKEFTSKELDTLSKVDEFNIDL